MLDIINKDQLDRERRAKLFGKKENKPLTEAEQAQLDRLLRQKPGIAGIDYVLWPGAKIEARRALWDRYVQLCERYGQARVNIIAAPLSVMGAVMHAIFDGGAALKNRLQTIGGKNQYAQALHEEVSSS